MELGDEERLLPTDLLNDDEDFESPNKIPLRKTWSWTPEQIHFEENVNDENCVKTKKPELRQLERAIKSLSIDPNMSISRKF